MISRLDNRPFSANSGHRITQVDNFAHNCLYHRYMNNYNKPESVLLHTVTQMEMDSHGPTNRIGAIFFFVVVLFSIVQVLHIFIRHQNSKLIKMDHGMVISKIVVSRAKLCLAGRRYTCCVI